MPRQIQFKLEDGTEVLVEVEDTTERHAGTTVGDMAARVKKPDVLQQATVKFEQALAVLTPVASAVISKLRAIPSKPAEVEVEFGFKLSAEAGAIIARTAAEANFKVTLKWKAAE